MARHDHAGWAQQSVAKLASLASLLQHMAFRDFGRGLHRHGVMQARVERLAHRRQFHDTDFREEIAELAVEHVYAHAVKSRG